MGTPIWDEVSANMRTAQESAYARGVIETRLAIAKQLSKFIKDLERGK
jgi:hypothetical protein